MPAPCERLKPTLVDRLSLLRGAAQRHRTGPSNDGAS